MSFNNLQNKKEKAKLGNIREYNNSFLPSNEECDGGILCEYNKLDKAPDDDIPHQITKYCNKQYLIKSLMDCLEIQAKDKKHNLIKIFLKGGKKFVLFDISHNYMIEYINNNISQIIGFSLSNKSISYNYFLVSSNYYKNEIKEKYDFMRKCDFRLSNNFDKFNYKKILNANNCTVRVIAERLNEHSGQYETKKYYFKSAKSIRYFKRDYKDKNLKLVLIKKNNINYLFCFDFKVKQKAVNNLIADNTKKIIFP